MLDKYFRKTKPTTPKDTTQSSTQSSIQSSTQSSTISQNHCSPECGICKLDSFIEPGWRDLLKEELLSNYFVEIKKTLHSTPTFYPPVENIFGFSHLSPFANIKVVIIGQDPYHNPGQAMGLSFSVPASVRVPPSLQNIYKELATDIPGFIIPRHGDLTQWARQGVLLLNHTLTVARNSPGSHADIGWGLLTGKILELINTRLDNVVFLLWGSHARRNAKLIDSSRHLVLEAAHPSPFSAKMFFGCRHFSKANEYLKDHSKGQIDWSLGDDLP